MASPAFSSLSPGTLPPAQCPEDGSFVMKLEKYLAPDYPPVAWPGLQCRRGGGEGRRRGRWGAGGSHSIGSRLL